MQKGYFENVYTGVGCKDRIRVESWYDRHTDNRTTYRERN